MRPWSHIKIKENSDVFERIPDCFYLIEPHPYLSLGAPYLNDGDPWNLREDVIKRLLIAHKLLEEKNCNFRLAIFDAWRPIAVQSFMIEYSINQNCESKGIDRTDPKVQAAYKEIVDEVNKFWAQPSENRNTPPPHSTGGAIDLTLADSECSLIDMGGAIDLISPISNPYYYSIFKDDDFNSKEATWHDRRMLLAEVMRKAGFVSHPMEWWHFSYGDQLWAWSTDSPNAIYGRVDDVSKFNTLVSPKLST